MKKIYKILLSLLLSVSCVTPFFIKDVEAAARTIEVPYDEPLKDSNHGYISVLFKNNSSDSYFVMTFVWSITNENANGGDSGMKLSITDNSIEFISQLPTGDDGYSFIYRFNGAGSDITVNQYQYFTTSCNPSYKYTTSSYTIKGYHAQGNVKHIVDETSSTEAFSVRWGSESGISNRLDTLISAVQSLGITDSSILTEIESISGNISTIKTKVNNIYTKIATIDTNVNNIYQSMLTANEWLENIRNGISITNTHLITIKNTLSDIYTELSEDIHNLLVDIKTYNKNILAKLDDIYVDLTTNIHQKLDSIRDSIQELIDNGIDVNNETTDVLQENLQEDVDEYNDIENTIIGNFEDSLNAVKPQSNLLTQSDFVKTGVFLSTQMTNIYNTNNIFKMTLTFGMIIGIAFTIIGISLKR